MEPININLATVRYVDKRISLGVVAFAIVLAVVVTGLNSLHYSKGKDAIVRYRERISLLKAVSIKKQKHAKVEESVDDGAFKRIQAEKESVNRLILLDSFPWPEIFDLLEQTTPPKVVLSDLTHSDDFSRLSLNGRAETAADMAVFIRQLEAGDLFLDNELSSLSFVPDKEEGGIGFSITGGLNMKNFIGEPLYGTLSGFPVKGAGEKK